MSTVARPDLVRIIAHEYRTVLADPDYLPAEKVGYIAAVCGVDPVIPSGWLTDDKRLFAQAVIDYHEADKVRR